MKGVRIDPERVEVRRLLRNAPLAGARVVEIGCGNGRLTRRIQRWTKLVEGIDPDTNGIAEATRRAQSRGASKTRFRVGSAEHLPFPPRSFQVALFSWSL